MCSERGQGTVEWVGIILLVALVLAALSHFASRADGRDLGRAVARSVIRPALAPAAGAAAPAVGPAAPAVGPGLDRGAAPALERPAIAPGERAFPIPPLIPRAGEAAPPPRTRLPSARTRPPSARTRPPSGRTSRTRIAPTRTTLPRMRIALPRARTLLQRVRPGAVRAWRRAWIACLIYERFRYAFLHPESRFPGHTIPPAEVLRMVNDCISPLDLFRDWPELSRR